MPANIGTSVPTCATIRVGLITSPALFQKCGGPGYSSVSGCDWKMPSADVSPCVRCEQPDSTQIDQSSAQYRAAVIHVVLGGLGFMRRRGCGGQAELTARANYSVT